MSPSALLRLAAHKRNVKVKPIKAQVPSPPLPPHLEPHRLAAHFSQTVSKFALNSAAAIAATDTVDFTCTTKAFTPRAVGPTPRSPEQEHMNFPIGGTIRLQEPYRLAYTEESWQVIREKSFRTPTWDVYSGKSIWDESRNVTRHSGPPDTPEQIEQHCQELWHAAKLVDEKLVKMGWCATHDTDLFSTLLLHAFYFSTDVTTSNPQSLCAMAIQVRHMLQHFSLPLGYYSPHLCFERNRPTTSTLLLLLGGMLNMAAVFVDDHDGYDFAFPIFQTCLVLYQDRYRCSGPGLLEPLTRWATPVDESDDAITQGRILVHRVHQAADLTSVQCLVLGIFPRLLNYDCSACRVSSCYGMCAHLSPPRAIAPCPPLVVDYTAIHYHECHAQVTDLPLSGHCQGDCVSASASASRPVHVPVSMELSPILSPDTTPESWNFDESVNVPELPPLPSEYAYLFE